MDALLQSLLNRLEHLSDQFRDLREGVQKAIRIADDDPEMAVVRARKVLEYVVRDVYQRRINEPPGTRPLEGLLQRLVKDGYFPVLLDANAATVRILGNAATHNFIEKVEPTQAYNSLAQLMPILEWYFEVERPEALDGQPVHPQSVPLVETRLSDRCPPAHMAIVPKGLRSFDAKDADFFLDLLPGARDKDGLPESIRFWKHRIEATDEATFTVGVIYGPSGCGKSSLVQAGLLPNLASDIVALYVEATANDTESRLLKGLRKRCPDLPSDLGLAEMVTALRSGGDKKVLIVLDQFEQWLHAHRSEQDTELAQALRQCDGEHVKCILLVRDDFGLALYRFMGDLHIEVVQGKNMAVVDLFDPIHARNVLAAFGRAYGRLQEATTNDEESFLDHAIQGLAQEGRVISVRLALFAEMVKGKPWVPSTLQGVGGTEGIGVNFLQETFCSRTAIHQHRLHENAARGVLKALLPEVGVDIRGHMRSHDDLLQASGYQSQPQAFSDLLRILDTELRLITPTDPEKLQSESASNPGSKYFQLTHDYLVPSLREWLTRKQKETRRGRSELRLADRAASWNDKPENRHLPSLFEYLNIRLLTKGNAWTPVQRKMMQRAGRVLGIRSGIAFALFVALTLSGLAVSRQIEEKRRADYAASLVDQLVSADIAQVPDLIAKLAGYRRWADPLLKHDEESAKEGSTQKLHLKLALLAVDKSQVESLQSQLITVTPTQFPVVRDALLTHKNAIVEPLWNVVLDPKRQTQERFQVACALATYAPDDEHWSQINMLVAGHLVSRPASDFLAWRETLRFAKQQLLKPLALISRDRSQREQQRLFATEALADYAADSPNALFELLADAEPFQFPALFDTLFAYKEQAAALAQQELEKQTGETATEGEKEVLAKRQANAGIMLFKLGNPGKLWPLVRHTRDPRVRSYVIHLLSPLGSDPKPIVERLDSEPDLTIRRALLLILGEFGTDQLLLADREPIIPRLLQMYRDDPDSGLHGASAWLLNQWNQQNRLAEIDKQFATGKVEGSRRWYVNGQGQTMVVIPSGVEFVMGSPPTEDGREGGREGKTETQHPKRIGRSFAIGAQEVTVEQFLRFRKDHPFNRQYAPTIDCPINDVSWYDAVAYCNWLSEQEGIPQDQWCYLANDAGEFAEGMKLAPDYLHRTGYRLPSEAEWEFSCRAGALTGRFYGATEALLAKYAWYIRDSSKRWTIPVGSLQPNDLGLFDMLGNAWEWCQERYADHAIDIDDNEYEKSPKDNEGRALRGGSLYRVASLRCADRDKEQPANRDNYVGFRLARTLR